MSIGIDELFEMLNWNSSEEVQKEGIIEGLKVKNISIFMQPIEGKCIWENCAKIIEQKSDEILELYLFDLFAWLQDANWPGFDIIYNRIKAMPPKLLYHPYAYTIRKAMKLEDEMWLIYLASLSKQQELYNMLSEAEKDIIDKYLQ